VTHKQLSLLAGFFVALLYVLSLFAVGQDTAVPQRYVEVFVLALVFPLVVAAFEKREALQRYLMASIWASVKLGIYLLFRSMLTEGRVDWLILVPLAIGGAVAAGGQFLMFWLRDRRGGRKF